jgi:hypothetical protein
LDACLYDGAYNILGSNYYKVLIGTGFGLPSIKTLIRIVVRVFICDYCKEKICGDSWSKVQNFY